MEPEVYFKIEDVLKEVAYEGKDFEEDKRAERKKALDIFKAHRNIVNEIEI